MRRARNERSDRSGEGERESDSRPLLSAILPTKLFVPPLKQDLVSRRRLVDRLRDAVLTTEPPPALSLVSAPPGFGKTTLLSEWIDGDDAPVAWLALDELDNDPVRFFSHVVAAIQLRCPDAVDAVAGLLRSGEPPPGPTIASSLIQEVDRRDGPLVLILDDFHEVRSSAVIEAVQFLVDHITPKLRLVLSSRTDPPLALSRLRARGQLFELRSADLRFRTDEIERFLREGMGLVLEADDLALVEERTEGWVAGLRLARHACGPTGDAEALVRSLAGDQRFIMDYLLDEMLLRQSESRQEFLLSTAVLDRLDESLCAALTRSDDETVTLEELDRENVFLVALDAERRWYRYHHLFRDFLRVRLRKRYPDRLPRLHLTASRWFEDHGFEDEALHHAVSARDWTRTASLLAPLVRRMLARGTHHPVRRWLAEIPPEVRDGEAELDLAQGWAACLAGDLDSVAACVARRAPTDPSPSRTDLVEGQRRILESHLRRFRDTPESAVESARKALDLLPEAAVEERGHALLAEGIGWRLSGECRRASATLERCLELCASTDYEFLFFAASNILGNVEIDEARLEASERRLQRVIDLASELENPQVMESHAALGGILYEWNRLDEAETELDAALDLARQRGVESYWAHAQVLLARIALARGEPGTALHAMDHAVELIRQSGYELAIRSLRAQLASLQLACGDREAAWDWLETTDIDESVSPPSRRIEDRCRLGVLARLGRIEEAIEFAGPLVEAARAQRRLRDLLDLRVGLSTAFEIAGRRDEARATLESSLPVANAGGFVRLLLDEGDCCEELWAAMSASNSTEERALGERLVRAADARRSPAAGEGLSPRETEVLHKLAEGLTNQEIARVLYVSANTIKTHLQHIFEKLDARNRTEAVAQARDRGLLE